MNIQEILKYLPHAYPFVLVDRVLSFEKDKVLLAQKNVTFNEPFFPGHFPGNPVMPGVLIIEALAQAAALLSFLSEEGKASLSGAQRPICYFAGIDNARFKRPVVPGDVLHLEVQQISSRLKLFKHKAIATVDGQLVAEATLMTTSRDAE